MKKTKSRLGKVLELSPKILKSFSKQTKLNTNKSVDNLSLLFGKHKQKLNSINVSASVNLSHNISQSSFNSVKAHQMPIFPKKMKAI